VGSQDLPDFLQTDSLKLGRDSDPKLSALALLHSTAQKSHSHALERLVVEIKAHLSGPFDSVNNMIEKMIFRLMDEQRREDEHKIWCDSELHKTEAMKQDKQERLRLTQAQIKSETAAMARLAQEIVDDEQMINEIYVFVKNATEIRQAGKTESELAIKDAEIAQRALGNAIAVLRAFYENDGRTEEKLQEHPLPESPGTWDSTYTGVKDATKQPTGIISVLEVVESDFATSLAKEETQEADAAAEYQKVTQANKINKASMEQSVKYKLQEATSLDKDVNELASDKGSTADELAAVSEYYGKLRERCVAKPETYESRKQRRDAEIAGLKEALSILEQTSLVQRAGVHVRHQKGRHMRGSLQA